MTEALPLVGSKYIMKRAEVIGQVLSVSPTNMVLIARQDGPGVVEYSLNNFWKDWRPVEDEHYAEFLKVVTPEVAITAMAYILDSYSVTASDLQVAVKARTGKDIPIDMWMTFLGIAELENIIFINHYESRRDESRGELVYSTDYKLIQDDWEADQEN